MRSKLLLVAGATFAVALTAAWSGRAAAEEPAGQDSGAEVGAVTEPGHDAPEEDTGHSWGQGYYEWGPMPALTNNGKGYTLRDLVVGDDDIPIQFGGWMQWGYSTQSDGLFNNNPYQFLNHQTWMYLEKTMDTTNGFDWGARIDGMYGTDAGDTQSFGNPPARWDFQNGFDRGIYGFALPQVYVEGGYGDFSVKAGHFYTLLGYEVVTAPDNFFFSHAFTMYLSEAFTHTGVLGTWTPSQVEGLTLYGGWTLGWDTGFAINGDGNNFLGGFSYQPIEQATLTYITTFGDLGSLGSGYTHSIVLDTTPVDRLNYIIQSDLVAANQIGYSTIGINQYLIYQLFDELGIGTRIEWWKANGTSYYELTGGVNIKPIPNLIVRPEGRYQWSPRANKSSGIQSAQNPIGLPVDIGGIFGIDMIWTF
jgi:Putative beta-barrel porin-2, OmpL-like. bbp2